MGVFEASVTWYNGSGLRSSRSKVRVMLALPGVVVPCHNSPTGSELMFLCSSGCSPVLADQVLDDVGALDAGGHIGRLAGFVQRRATGCGWRRCPG